MTTAGLIMTSTGLIMTSDGLKMTSTRLPSCYLNLCLIWLCIFKCCFVDLGNGYIEYYVPTMFYDLCSDFCIRCTPPCKKTELWNHNKKCHNGHYTMTCRRYIKRQNKMGKCLFLPFNGSNFHLKYDFLTPGGLLFLPTKYQNFAQSPFKMQKWFPNSFESLL